MSKIENSKMLLEQVKTLEARQNEITNLINERKASFESEEDIEKRDAFLNEVETLKKEFESNKTQIEDLNERATKLAAQEKRMGIFELFGIDKTEERNKGKNDKYDTPEYRQAYMNYLISGDDKEVRALTTGTTNVPVPTIMQGYIETAWEKASNILDMVTVTKVRGIIAVGYESEAGDATYHTEGSAAPAEETLTFGQTLLTPKMLKKWISLSDELHLMTPEEFFKYVVDEVTYKLAVKLKHDILTGTFDSNKKGVNGIANAALTANVPGDLTFNSINKGFAELSDEAENIVVWMNKKTYFNNIKGLTDDNGRPIFITSNDVNGNRTTRYVDGFRVEFDSTIPAYDVAKEEEAYILMGDMRGYRLNCPDGTDPKIVYDTVTLAREDKEVITGKLFAAGNVVKPGMFVKLTKPKAAAKTTAK